MSKDTARPSFEYSVFLRFQTDGRVGPLRRSYFPSARLAFDFISRLDAGNPPQIVLSTIARREVGSWEHLDRRLLEGAAADEVGR